MSRSYEHMTLTERAEAHILSARQLLGGANQHYQCAALAANQGGRVVELSSRRSIGE